MESLARRKKRGMALLALLEKAFPEPACTLEFSTPLQMLIATLLSAQCTDKRVNMVTPSLFARFDSTQAFADAPLEAIEDAIRSTGFYRNKAKNIQSLCRILLDRFGGEVPQTLEELIQLPGVGRKTANVVLGNAFGVASGFVVDTHVGRLARRMGLTESEDPVKIEADLCAIFPKEEWIDLSHRLIQLGRSTCQARKVSCSECPVAAHCPKCMVTPKGSKRPAVPKSGKKQ